MSSPIANKDKNIVKQLLINFHQRISHNTRINKLSHILADHISIYRQGKAPLKCLDVGCGDMVIAENIAALNPETEWTCIDIHDLPENLEGSSKWKKYRKFNGIDIPFDDQTFDIIIFCDVLHHTQDTASKLIMEAARVGKIIIIKDHFEYGIYSQTMLKLMDFVGNWGYGINLPDKYFTEQSFVKLCNLSEIQNIHIHKGISLYKHIPLLSNILKPEWQFVAVLNTK